jgi:hypothetical protein
MLTKACRDKCLRVYLFLAEWLHMYLFFLFTMKLQTTLCMVCRLCCRPYLLYGLPRFKICIRSMFCLVSLICMSIGNSKACHMSHSHVGCATLVAGFWPTTSSPFVLRASSTMRAQFALLCTCCWNSCLGHAHALTMPRTANQQI